MHIIVQCELSFETQVITDWNVRPSADSGQSSILLRRRARAVGLFRLRLDDDLLNRGALLSLFVLSRHYARSRFFISPKIIILTAN